MLPTVPAKTLLTRCKAPGSWFGIDYNMNLYRGCCHGCLYCDSRSTCYGIENFGQVRVKENALRLLRDELRRKVRTGVVGTGSMSDPYNPFEKQLQLTRHALELLDAFGFGAAIATKSSLVLRDSDLLQEIAGHSPVVVKITITTPDDRLSRRLEPGVSPSSQRFAALEGLSREGIFCGVLLMPVLPFVEDDPQAVRQLLQRAADCGARFVYPYFGVTMRDGQREFFLQRLEETFPGQGLAQRYRQRYGGQYSCLSPRARELGQCFTEECRRLGLLSRMGEIISASRMGYAPQQLSLFD